MLNMHFQCGNCGVRLSVEPRQPGKALRCPYCETEMVPAVAIADVGHDPNMFEFGIARDDEEDSIFGSQMVPNDPFAETTPVVEIPAASEKRPTSDPWPPIWTVMPPLPRRIRRRRSRRTTYLLIFLVPYAILMTSVTLFLLFVRRF
jgi:hypothetical protein